jgi:hypothetical protein
MKSKTSKISALLALPLLCLAVMSFTNSSESSSVSSVEAGGPKVTCPPGDWYNCYTFADGGVVYKGRDGGTVIQF